MYLCMYVCVCVYYVCMYVFSVSRQIRARMPRGSTKKVARPTGRQGGQRQSRAVTGVYRCCPRRGHGAGRRRRTASRRRALRAPGATTAGCLTSCLDTGQRVIKVKEESHSLGQLPNSWACLTSHWSKLHLLGQRSDKQACLTTGRAGAAAGTVARASRASGAPLPRHLTTGQTAGGQFGHARTLCSGQKGGVAAVKKAASQRSKRRGRAR